MYIKYIFYFILYFSWKVLPIKAKDFIYRITLMVSAFLSDEAHSTSLTV